MKQKHEGELLTAFMQEKHLSNYKLAQMMGVYGSAVKYWQKLEHIPDGCLVDAKQLDPTHWKKLHPGRVFVFLHREMGLQVKLLMKQTGSKCVFRCINDYYPDFEIDLTDVLEVWYFVQKHDRNRDYSRYLVR